MVKKIMLLKTKPSQTSVWKKTYMFISFLVFQTRKKVLIIWFPYVKNEVQIKIVEFRILVGFFPI